jgi:hypothetical protein
MRDEFDVGEAFMSDNASGGALGLNTTKRAFMVADLTMGWILQYIKIFCLCRTVCIRAVVFAQWKSSILYTYVFMMLSTFILILRC